MKKLSNSLINRVALALAGLLFTATAASAQITVGNGGATYTTQATFNTGAGTPNALIIFQGTSAAGGVLTLNFNGSFPNGGATSGGSTVVTNAFGNFQVGTGDTFVLGTASSTSIDATGTLTYGQQSNAATESGTIVIEGTTQNLLGANIVLANGTVVATTNTAFGTAPITVQAGRNNVNLAASNAGNALSSLTLSNSITLNSTLNIVPSPGGAAGTTVPLTLSGIISGGSGLTLGTGVGLTLTGANSYSGNTTIGGNSALIIGTNTALGVGGQLRDTSGSTLIFSTTNSPLNTTNSLTIANSVAIANAGSTVIVNTSNEPNLIITGQVGTAAGGTLQVAAGSLELDANNNFFNNPILLGTNGAPATLIFQSSGSVNGGGGTGTVTTVAGSIGDVLSTSTNSTAFSSIATNYTTGSFTTASTVQVPTVNVVGGSSLTIEAQNTSTGSNTAIQVGTLTGTGTVTLAGPGVMYLPTNNLTFTGNENFSGGTVVVGANNSLGAASVAVTVTTNTILTPANAALNVPNNVTLNSGASLEVDVLTSLTPFELSGSFGGAGGMVVNNPNSFGGPYQGTVVLSGGAAGNTYSGATQVEGGVLQAATNSGNGMAFSPDSDFTLSNGSTLDLNGNNETVASLTGSAGTTVTSSIENNTVVTSTLTVDYGHSSLATTNTLILGATTYHGPESVFAGNLSDFQTNNGSNYLSLDVINSTTPSVSALVLTGTNTYAGDTLIGNTTVGGGYGEIVVGSTTALSQNSAFIVDYGVLDLNGYSNTIAGLGDNGLGVGVITSSGGTAVAPAILTINPSLFGTTIPAGLTTAITSLSNTFTGVITDGTASGNTGVLGLTLTGPNGYTLTLDPLGSNTLGGFTLTSNDYTGPTTINSGNTLKAGNTGAFSANSAFTNNGTMDLNGNSNTIQSLSGTNAGAIVTNSGAGTPILTINNNTNPPNIFTYNYAGDITGSMGVSLVGSSGFTEEVFSGSNSYTGPTSLTAYSILTAGSTSGLSAKSDFSMSLSSIDLNGFSNTIASLNGDANSAIWSGNDFGGNGVAVLTINPTATSPTSTFSGTLMDYNTNFSSATGTLGLTVLAGAATTLPYTLTLDTTQDNYSGATTIGSNAEIIAGAGEGNNTFGTNGNAGFSGALSPNSDFTVNGELNLNGFSNQIASLSGSGLVTSATAATLTIDPVNAFNSSQTTFSGNITGALALTLDAGDPLVLTLSGDNTYTGTTLINTGVTLIAASTTALSPNSDYVNNGGLDVNYSNTIGSLSSTTNTGVVALANGTVLTIGNTNKSPGAYAGIIDGQGGIKTIGTGVLYLTGSNTYSGGSNFAGGEVEVGNNSALGSGAVTVTAQTKLETDNLNTYTLGNGFVLNTTLNVEAPSNGLVLAGVISGSGDLQVHNGGILALTGVDTYNGATGIHDGSTLIIGLAGQLGSGDYEANIYNYGTFDYESSAAQTLSGVISGSGAVMVSGSGVLTLTGVNTYTGSTTIDTTSTLTIGGAGKLGSGDYEANIVDNGSFDYESSAPQTLSGVISGGGTVTVSGAGTLTLTGANTYGGSTTVNNGSTLTISGAGDLGSGDYEANIIDNGSFDYESSTPQTLSGVISGGGTVTVSGSGTVTLTGNNSYSGMTTINSGSTLVTAGEGLLGQGDYEANIVDNGTFTDNSSQFQELSGVISGSGVLNNSGGNTLQLTGANTFNGGSISISNDSAIDVVGSGDLGSTGSGTGNYTGPISIGTGSEFVYESSATQQLSGVISGGGSVFTDNGTLYLTNANTYSGGTTFDGGTVEVGSSSVVVGGVIQSGPLGTGQVTVEGATLLTADTLGNYTVANNFDLLPPMTVNAPTGHTMTLSGNIFGTDGLTVNNGTAGTVILSGTNTYGFGHAYSSFTGETIVDAGVLQAGSSTGLSPFSDFTLNNASTLNLAGNSNTIATLSSAVKTTTLTNTGTTAATLTIDDSNTSYGFAPTYTFAGLISDTNTAPLSLVKEGAGTLILTDTNTYTGGTTLTSTFGSGVIAVGTNTALGTGFVTVTGGTLETTATSSATAPVHFTVGAYAQSGGTLQLQAASPANYDSMTATSVNLASTNGPDLLYLNLGAFAAQGQRYVVVTSGAASPVVGTFANSINSPTYLTGDITGAPAGTYEITTYNDNFNGTVANNSVVITLVKPFNGFAGLTPNQTNVANSVDSTLTALDLSGQLLHPTGLASDFFNNIITGLNNASMSPGVLGEALDQLSPQRLEILHNVAFDNYAFDVSTLDAELARERNGQGGAFDTSGFTFNDSTIGSQLSSVKSRLLAWNPAPEGGLLSDTPQPILGGVEMTDAKDMKQMNTPPAGPENKWNGFLDGGVDLGDLESNADASHASYTTGRVRAGVDYRVTTDLRVGVLFGYNHTDADMDEEGSKAHVDSYQPGLFATYADKDGFYANALFTGAVNDYSINRDIQFSGVNSTATSSPSGDQFAGDLDGGYEFHSGNWTYGPSAGLVYVNSGIDSFTEGGAGAADLAVNSQSFDSLRSLLGGGVRYEGKIGSVDLSPHLNASWQHEYLNQSTGITSQFAGLPGGGFTVQTTKGDRDNALLGFGIDADIVNGVTIFVDYETEAGGSSFFGQSATGGVKISY